MKAMWLLTSIGLYTSLYLVFGAPSDSLFCSYAAKAGANISCSSVLKSEYSKIVGIPVSILGLCYFLVQVVILVAPETDQIKQVSLFCYSVVGSLFCVYFIYAEYMLGSLCPLCTVVHVATFSALYVTYPKGFRFNLKSMLSLLWVMKVYVLIALIVVGIPLFLYHPWPKAVVYAADDMLALTQCVTSRKISMYGMRGCRHCDRQKRVLGPAFGLIDYIDCSRERNRCQSDGIQRFPTWAKPLQENGTRVTSVGVMNVTQLAEFAECDIPIPLNLTEVD